MINSGDSVYTTLHYAGAQSSGKMTYLDNEFVFESNKVDNLTKGLGANSMIQNCSFRYEDVRSLKKSGFLFVKVITMHVASPDGKEELISLYTRQANDVLEFLKTKVDPAVAG